MVINYLNIKCITIAPNETDAILVIDANTVLALPLPLQSLKIPWKNCQIAKEMGCVYLQELSLRNSGDLLKPPRALAFK